jgi:sec-independent protein translocase protein TatB
MSFSETIFLFFLALVIFGPKKLPEIARQVGKLLNEFRRASNEFKSQIEQEIAHLEVEEKKKTILPPIPSVEGTTSRAMGATSSASSYPSYRTPDSDNTATEPAPTPVTVSADPAPPANGNAAAEPVPEAETIASPTSQESHA